MNIKLALNKLYSSKKVLLILLFVMFLVPKNVFAFTVTYKSYGGIFDDGTDTNVVEYDNNKNIVDGEYKNPIVLNSCGDKEFTGWFTDKNMKNQYYLRDSNSNITVYAGYTKYTSCFEYIAQSQIYIVRKNANYQIQLWGSSGQESWPYSANTRPGRGAYVSGKIDLAKEENIYVYVGGNTKVMDYYTFNGGGGYTLTGGGATDIRLVNGDWNDSSSLASRIMVAGGGGGGFHLQSTSSVPLELKQRGDAGGLEGYDAILTVKSSGAVYANSGEGGTQTSGGLGKTGATYPNSGPINGSFGIGGYGTNSLKGNSSGGGGYYGGGIGIHTGWDMTGGGGGSSYISGHDGCIAITGENDLTPSSDSIHYSGRVFTDTVMIDGSGYQWTNTKSDTVVGMPKTSGTGTETGHLGTGYAKIGTTEETFHTVTFKHTGEDDFTVYVIDGEKVVRPNVYLTASTGYTVHSWEINGTTTEWDFDDPVTEDLVLKTYKTIDTYNITYNITGGTVSGNPDTYTVEDLPISLNNPTPTEPGYIFTGWTGTGLSEKTMNVTIPVNSTGDREYTAHFEKEKYTITYNLNGGDLETGVTNPEEYYVDTPDITLNNPAREGYTFLGWTGSNGTTPTNVIIATGSTGNKTYTANYQIDSHTATFDSNLGSTAVPLTITKDYNQELGSLPTTSRVGYIFDGWFTGKEDGSQISSTTKMPAYNPTYYAHWTPITYTIHFNNNSGTGTMPDETMTYGVSKALDENTFTRDGYTFAGWNTKADGTGTNYIDKQEIFNLTDIDGTEFTLYAKWTKDEYIINYDPDGGQLDNPKTTYSVDDEEFTLVKPTKVGYDFVGWTGTGVSTPTKNVVIPTGSTGTRSYTAHWTETIYTIEYIRNYDNATVTVAGNLTSYKITDSDITLNNPGDPDTYHFFTGWTTNLDTESDLSTSFVIPSGSTGNIKIYAVFQTSPYTVSFDSDGGNNIDPISRLGTEDVGPLPIPVKAGYTFKGWFVNDKLIDQTFHSRVDVTAIAKWEKNPDPVKPIIINPTTGDNVMTYIMMLLISVIGLGYTGYKYKLKTKKTQ